MTIFCELCGKAIPPLPAEELVKYGYQEVVWEGSGPYRFCSAHTGSDIVRWIAETLICDRKMIQMVRRGMA